MGLLKTALIGAAVYGAVKYLTKKDALGTTKLVEIKEKAVSADLKSGTMPQV